MIPKFKFYFNPFLSCLRTRGNVRLASIANYCQRILGINSDDVQERTKGGSITKHLSRVYYCAAYLKRMGFVSSNGDGVYQLTARGKEVLKKLPSDFSMDDLRDLPEYATTQISRTNEEVVMVDGHMRGGKYIPAYGINKKYLKEKNPYKNETITKLIRDKLIDAGRESTSSGLTADGTKS